jgi:hypothetical protein
MPFSPGIGKARILGAAGAGHLLPRCDVGSTTTAASLVITWNLGWIWSPPCGGDRPRTRDGERLEAALPAVVSLRPRIFMECPSRP